MGLKANVRAIRQILDQPGRRDYTVIPNAPVNTRHDWMAFPLTIPTKHVRRKRFSTGFLRDDGPRDDNTAFAGVQQ